MYSPKAIFVHVHKQPAELRVGGSSIKAFVRERSAGMRAAPHSVLIDVGVSALKLIIIW